MSPAKTHGQEQGKRVINGPRPTPLSIKMDSHPIKKPSSSSFPRNQTQQSHHPKIVYAYSPKIIHTKPRDFLALVQRLTGRSRPEEGTKKEKEEIKVDGENNESSSSIVTDENCSNSAQFSEGANEFLADMPLFTPNTINLFYSPLPLHRFADMVSVSPKKELPQY